MKRKGHDRKYCYRTGDLARIKGISRRITLREIRNEVFNADSLESVIEWLSKPYVRPYKRRQRETWGK